MIADNPKSRIHELKTWPEFFQAIKHGFKTWELRKNDRDYQLGDYLNLREYNPITKEYTKDKLLKRVNYIVKGPRFGLERGFVIMGIVDDPFGPIDELIKR